VIVNCAEIAVISVIAIYVIVIVSAIGGKIYLIQRVMNVGVMNVIVIVKNAVKNAAIVMSVMNVVI
jgi:hypothetical protein